MIRGWLALVAAAAAVGCGESAPRLDLSGAREVRLTLTFRETVSFRGASPAKELRLLLRGDAVDEGGTWHLETAVGWAELTYVDGTGQTLELGTDGVRADPVHADPLTRARRGILEGLVGAPVRLTFVRGDRDESVGLRSVTGLREALRASEEGLHGTGLAPPGVDAAIGGLEPLLDDEAAWRGLAAAGLGPAPTSARTPGRDVRRTARVHAEGAGEADVALLGSCGEGRGGAPTVRLSGTTDSDTAWSGEAGAAPPAWPGAVRRDALTVAAETEYEPDALRPLRGSVTVELPHEAGPLVRRTTEFVMVVLE